MNENAEFDSHLTGTIALSQRRPRIRVLNGHASDARLPLAACDCDNHTTCDVHVDVCGADEIDADADAKVCGIWG